MITKRYLITSIFFILLSINLNGQTERNPVLEYCTGTWCQYCPCGHSIIADQVLANNPSAIIISYHGPLNYGDPYAGFPGYQVIGALGLTNYPTGIVDRTSAPASRTTWNSKIIQRKSIPATVSIDLTKTYDNSTRQLDLTFCLNPLDNLVGNYRIMVVVVEDGLIHSQSCNTSVCGCGSSNISDYEHFHVARTILSGWEGELINDAQRWNIGATVYKQYSYTVPLEYKTSNCHVIAYVYNRGQVLNLSEIQQGKEWELEGNLPVEFISFNSLTSKNKIELKWVTATETNNKGFEIEKSENGTSFSKIGFVNGNGTSTETHSYSFIDPVSETVKQTFYYRLKQIDYDGSTEYSNTLTVQYDFPAAFLLEQNYPNPFNPVTAINFTIPKADFVNLSIFDILGTKVKELVNEFREAGVYEVVFDGSEFSSGTYVYKLTSGENSQIKKMTLLK